MRDKCGGQGTGFGITANIIDCYAALIRLSRPGDRIYLFGFSRGAYTVRCLAAVIASCGIPTKLPRDKPLKLDVASSRKLASYAVKRFTSSRPRPSTILPDTKAQGRQFHVRFTPKSGHRETRLGCPVCAKTRRTAPQQKVGRLLWRQRGDGHGDERKTLSVVRRNADGRLRPRKLSAKE
jgi:T6SS, Phospholipase effector Tle1-like, catalytic domain